MRARFLVLVALLLLVALNVFGDQMLSNPNPTPNATPYKPPPNAVVIEPYVGPWKNSPDWGNQFDGPMPASANIVLPTFSGEKLPGPPRVQSIVLTRDPQSAPGTNADFRAQIDYSVGSLSDSFLCDWTRGQQFSLVANWVRVTAISYAPSTLVAYNAQNGNVKIAAAIAEGAIQKTTPLTFTTPLFAMGNNTTVTISAPDFASAFFCKVIPAAPLPTPSLVKFAFIAGTASLAQYDSDYFANAPRGVLLPGGTRVVTITNTSGIAITLAPQWILGL